MYRVVVQLWVYLCIKFDAIMKTSFVLLFKGALGGGGFGAMIVSAAVIYYIYRKEKYCDSGCLSVLLLPLMPLFGLFSLFGKMDEAGLKADMKYSGKKQFDQPPCLLLKVLVALSGIGLWIYGMLLMGTYEVSWVLFGLWILMPFPFAFLYILWLQVFFVWLGEKKKSVAHIITILSIILIIVFWIVSIRVYNHYTSIEYLRQYWERKYGVL